MSIAIPAILRNGSVPLAAPPIKALPHLAIPASLAALRPDRFLWAIEPEILSRAGYSDSYIAIRERFINDFLFRGYVASMRCVEDGNEHVEFGDQSMYMGHAMISFSLECKRLREQGLPTASSNSVISSILGAFRSMEHDADVFFNGIDTAGFFYRDAVTRDMLPGWVVKSDFISAVDEGNDSLYAMSVDQVVYLFVGYLAVYRWAGNSQNSAYVKEFATRIIELLISKDYEIDRTPRGHEIIEERGPHYWWACGWLSWIATQVTGRDYLNDPANRVGDRSIPDAHRIIAGVVHNPSLLAIGQAAEVIISAFGRRPLEVKTYSSPHAMVRFALLSTASTPDYSMWAWSNTGRCPWSSLLYCLISGNPIPSNMPESARVMVGEMPATGPSSELARTHGWRHTWGKDSSIVRSLDLTWRPESRPGAERREERYNGLDYMMLEGLLLATEGMPLTGRPCQRGDRIVWTPPGVLTC